MLTSVQEAALNAAGEAVTDLGIKVVLSCGNTDMGGGQFYAFTPSPRGKGTLFGDANPTLAGAVSSLLAKHEEAKNAPPILTTAAEAVAAARAAIIDFANEGNDGEGASTVDVVKVVERIDALPVE